MDIAQIITTIISCLSLILSAIIWKDKKAMAAALSLQAKNENTINMVAEHTTQLAVIEAQLQNINNRLDEHPHELSNKLDLILKEIEKLD